MEALILACDANREIYRATQTVMEALRRLHVQAELGPVGEVARDHFYDVQAAMDELRQEISAAAALLEWAETGHTLERVTR